MSKLAQSVEPLVEVCGTRLTTRTACWQRCAGLDCPQFAALEVLRFEWQTVQTLVSVEIQRDNGSQHGSGQRSGDARLMIGSPACYLSRNRTLAGWFEMHDRLPIRADELSPDQVAA